MKDQPRVGRHHQRLGPKDKHESKAWQKRHLARKAKQDAYAQAQQKPEAA